MLRRASFRSKFHPAPRLRDREPAPVTVRAVVRGTYAANDSIKTMPKAGDRKKTGATNEERAHKAKLAGLGCMACLRLHGPHTPGPVELHHLRTGGWGRGGFLTLIPLCVEHHRGPSGVHGMGTRGFAKYYDFDQRDLLADALGLLEVTT